MKKLDALKKFLLAYIPELKRNPDNLTVSVQRGQVVARDGENLGFEYVFTASLIVTDYTCDPDTVFMPLMLWVRENQRDLVQNFDKSDNNISFQVDIIDDATVDIAITLPLTEAVDVRRRKDGGGYDLTHRDEPPQIDAFLTGFPDLPGCETLLRQIYTNGGLLLPADDAGID